MAGDFWIFASCFQNVKFKSCVFFNGIHPLEHKLMQHLDDDSCPGHDFQLFRFVCGKKWDMFTSFSLSYLYHVQMTVTRLPCSGCGESRIKLCQKNSWIPSWLSRNAYIKTNGFTKVVKIFYSLCSTISSDSLCNLGERRVGLHLISLFDPRLLAPVGFQSTTKQRCLIFVFTL